MGMGRQWGGMGVDVSCAWAETVLSMPVIPLPVVLCTSSLSCVCWARHPSSVTPFCALLLFQAEASPHFNLIPFYSYSWNTFSLSVLPQPYTPFPTTPHHLHTFLVLSHPLHFGLLLNSFSARVWRLLLPVLCACDIL